MDKTDILHHAKFIRLQKIALKNYERFEATLSEEQKKLFEEVLDNLFKLDGLSREAEKRGLKFCLRRDIMAAI